MDGSLRIASFQLTDKNIPWVKVPYICLGGIKYGYLAPTPTPLSHIQNFLLWSFSIWRFWDLSFNTFFIYSCSFLFYSILSNQNTLWRLSTILGVFSLYSIYIKTQCHLVALFSLLKYFIILVFPSSARARGDTVTKVYTEDAAFIGKVQLRRHSYQSLRWGHSTH